MTEAKGLYKVKLGQVIKSPTIRRTDVAEGTKGRALMLSDDWLACAVAFTEEPLPRGVFYVTEEDVVKYGLQARVFYIALIARLNTDSRGNILDDTFNLEFLRLGEQQYEEYANRAVEMKKVETVTLTKQTRGTYSFIKVDPSQIEQDPKVMKPIIEKLKGLDLDSCLSLVVQSVARPFSAFEEAYQKSQGVRAIPPASGVSRRPAIAEAPEKHAPVETEKIFESNFGETDDNEWE